jgi:hypothetical protein
VISTGGDATLSVVDGSGVGQPGKLYNSTTPGFSLASAVQLAATSPVGTGAASAAIGSTALTVLTYAMPVSNDPVTLTFTQPIAALEALRTGTYSKTLTLTLASSTL